MSPTSWLMDFACFNHMTPHLFLFSDLKLASHPFNIRTANGFTMFGHNIDSISTFIPSIPGVFNVPDLSYNLFSVGQLAELGYRIIFDYSRCIVQDPRTRQELEIDPRFGHMFLVDNLCRPLLLLLFLLLQLLQFLQFLSLHFGMLDLVTRLLLRYKNWLLEVC